MNSRAPLSPSTRRAIFWGSLTVAVATPLVFVPYAVLAATMPVSVFPTFLVVWLMSMVVLAVWCVASLRDEPRLARIGFAVLAILVLFLLLGISVGPLKHFI